jgi:hypothetical protein
VDQDRPSHAWTIAHLLSRRYPHPRRATGGFVSVPVTDDFYRDLDQALTLTDRILIGYSGHLGAYAVEGQLAWDDVFELTSLTVDAAGPVESLPD